MFLLLSAGETEEEEDKAFILLVHHHRRLNSMTDLKSMSVWRMFVMNGSFTINLRLLAKRPVAVGIPISLCISCFPTPKCFGYSCSRFPLQMLAMDPFAPTITNDNVLCRKFILTAALETYTAFGKHILPILKKKSIFFKFSRTSIRSLISTPF